VADRPRYLSDPYGQEELEFMLQPWFDLDVVESGTMPPIADLPGRIRKILGNPIGYPPLHELARKAVADAAPRPATAVIAVTDLTRASPDAVLVPPLLDELNAGGIPDTRITVIVAVGLHRATTDAEKRQ
jgi:nickel-dependent lactate racemase